MSLVRVYIVRLRQTRFFYKQRINNRDLNENMQLSNKLHSNDNVVKTLEKWIRQKRVSRLD